MNDLYLEHSQHIKGENGKIVPFFRNQKTCSTCYSEHQKAIDRIKNKRSSLIKPPYEQWQYRIN